MDALMPLRRAAPTAGRVNHAKLKRKRSVTRTLPTLDGDTRHVVLLPPSDADEAERDYHAAEPVASVGAGAVSPRRLAPLDVQVLQRQRLFLQPHGGPPVVGIEEIVRFSEPPPAEDRPRVSPLQLALMPKKVAARDEVALMPCHSLEHRLVPTLSVEQWREPLRDRDKRWVDDELSVLLALQGERATRALCRMTRLDDRHKGKWRRWDAQRLHLHRSSASARGSRTATSGSSAVSACRRTTPREATRSRWT
ncbi:hypothetical protein PINS_up008855 [Pythium insidiosum]|nr:hypothetical protein PINS_up008855 [Pythium insidiosum]